MESSFLDVSSLTSPTVLVLGKEILGMESYLFMDYSSFILTTEKRKNSITHIFLSGYKSAPE